jgi:hypothetical protein
MIAPSLSQSISHDLPPSQAPSGSSISASNRPLGIRWKYCGRSVPDFQQQEALKRRFTLVNIARDLLPDWSVAKCYRWTVGGMVEVLHHAEYMRASYGGLMTCKSVHVCAMCGSKIAERRAQEIQQAVTRWTNEGGTVVLATFTLQHNHTDGLAALGSSLNEAYRKLHSGRPWRTFAEHFNIAGGITAREYTFGAHGWHPHLHTLWFHRKPVARRELHQMERWVQAAWKPALKSFGRFAELRIGATVRMGDEEIGHYVTKTGRAWTVGDELAKANRKQARSKGSRSIIQLLADSGSGDELAGLRFTEYAEYTFRRNALVWSKGLRSLVGVDEDEQTDEEIAGEQLADGRLLVILDRGQWQVVLGNDSRAELLLEAAEGEISKVQSFLALLGVQLESWQIGESAE